MTNNPLTESELADMFGVDAVEEISDDLYQDYLNYLESLDDED